VVVVVAIVGQQVNLRHRVTVKTAVPAAAAAILLLGQELALAVPPRKATAAALRVMVTLAVMGIPMALQTPLAVVLAVLAVQVLRLRFKPIQQAAMAARLILAP